MVPTRQGDVPARFYRPAGTVRRTVLLLPGIHSMGIDEPRLHALAHDLAGSGVRVMTLALPDLQRYRITPQSSDVIEDTVAWMVRQPDLAPDGRVGVVGISFSGGLSIVAAGRPSIRDRVAFVVSFGGHGDLPRVLKYLSTGDAPQVEGIATHPPHDYGVAVILYGLADQMVPPAQVEPLREGVRTFLLASQLTLVDMNRANATFSQGSRDGEGTARAIRHASDLRQRPRRQEAGAGAGSVRRPPRRGFAGRLAAARTRVSHRAGLPAARRWRHGHSVGRIGDPGRVPARSRR